MNTPVLIVLGLLIIAALVVVAIKLSARQTRGRDGKDEPTIASPEAAATDPGVVATCQKCRHKFGIVIRAGRARGGTFASCPKCNAGGIYDEYGQSYSPAQHAAEEIIRKYSR